MRFTKVQTLFSILAAGAVLSLSSCKKDDNTDWQEPPADSEPQITLVTPTTSYTLARVGDVVTYTYELHDNELLKSFQLMEKITSVSGVVTQPEQAVAGSLQALSSNTFLKQIQYTVPNVPVYTKIELRGVVTDNRGRQMSHTFVISVIPTSSGGGSLHSIQEYPDGDTIWSVLSGDDYYFDLINRRHGGPADIASPDRLLGEVSSGSFGGALNSPIWASTDSVMVLTNTGVFDYANLTWETTWQAFVTSNRIGRQAGPSLNAGDVVIMKMPVAPHYAIIHIKERNAAGQFLVFEYKYTY